MTPPVLRIGTRGSTLALTQSGQVGSALLAAAGAGSMELVRIRTEGDVNAGPLATIGGTGVFVTAVREALLAGRVDLVVHSFKDLPTAAVPGIELAAVPCRESPSDAVCARDGRRLAELPIGARIGTGSPRRTAQLRWLRRDLQVVAIRGNVETRLATVSSGDLDAVMLAAAGLHRLGRQEAITEEFDPIDFLPAPAQGALAVETRAGEDLWFAGALTVLDDAASRWAAIAERAVLAGLEAGCSSPVSAFGTVTDGRLSLAAQVTTPDGTRMLRRDRAAPVADDAAAAAAGTQLAGELLAGGAAELMSARS